MQEITCVEAIFNNLFECFSCDRRCGVCLKPFLVVIVHYDDVIMGVIASQITSLTIVYSTVYSGEDQSKQQSSESLAFVWGIHRGPANSPHKCPVTRKIFPFDDVIMHWCQPQNDEYSFNAFLSILGECKYIWLLCEISLRCFSPWNKIS